MTTPKLLVLTLTDGHVCVVNPLLVTRAHADGASLKLFYADGGVDHFPRMGMSVETFVRSWQAALDAVDHNENAADRAGP